MSYKTLFFKSCYLILTCIMLFSACKDEAENNKKGVPEKTGINPDSSINVAEESPDTLAIYKSDEYHVTFRYPAHWKKNPTYLVRYDGADGFFELTAMAGGDSNIDTLAKNDANHKMQPYGKNPVITSLKIAGREARLITPSADQDKSMEAIAGLIIQYPQPIKIKAHEYPFCVLWADKGHIMEIGRTLTFIY